MASSSDNDDTSSYFRQDQDRIESTMQQQQQQQQIQNQIQNNEGGAVEGERGQEETDNNDNDDEQDNDNKNEEEINLAKRMFYGGFLGLPWLWICNVLYFRKRVYGPLQFIDYWPGSSGSSSSSSSDNNNNAGEGEATEEAALPELQKWVQRSTVSALVGVSLFIAWIVTFQVNKDHFGSRWFVMSESEEDRTGW